MKRRGLSAHNQEGVKSIREHLNMKIGEGKENYRRKLELKLQQNNTRDIWRGLRIITGFGSVCNRGAESSMEPALFFHRFDTP